MSKSSVLALVLVACSSSHPPASTPAASTAMFELGELSLVEDGKTVLAIHRDGSTEIGYRSGSMTITPGQTASTDSLPLRLKAGPTIKADGTFAHEGRDVARMTADGTFVGLKDPVGPIPDIAVSADRIAFAKTQVGEVSFEVAADGSITQRGGNASTLGSLRIVGADTPAKRRAILALAALVLAPKKHVVEEAPSPVPATP
jgi:hypothetical protein